MVPLAAALLACGPTKTAGRALGEPCSPAQGQESGNAQCSEQLCVALDSASGFCSRTCDDDSDCNEAGFRCEAAGSYGLVCQALDGCADDSECPAGHSCNLETGNCYIKVSRTLCSPCSDGAQCPGGGYCYTALGSGEQFCTQPCTEAGTCPNGYTCRDIPAGPTGGNVAQCVPTTGTCNAGKEICAFCNGDNECGGPFDLCVRNVVSGETFCGKDCRPKDCTKGGAPGVPGVDCTASDECPTGFSCLDLGGAAEGSDRIFQCVPNSNTCVNYCDAQDELGEIRECGLGQDCDVSQTSCKPATDGRMCAPCLTNDDCSKSGGAHPENRCLVNDCPDCPFKGESFCATPCGDTPGLTGNQACVRAFGPGFICQDVGDNVGGSRTFCMPQRGTCASGLGRLGDDCAQNGAQDCVAGVCLASGTTRICSLRCGQDSDCADNRYQCCEFDANGYNCNADRRSANGPANGQGVCAPAGGLFGDDCSPGRLPCQSGACLDLGTARLCTNRCENTPCPDGFSCRTAQPPNGEPVQVCFPGGGGGAGADCTFGPAACESGLCIRKETGNVCTQACTADDGCPADWACTPDTRTVTEELITACIPPSLQR